METYLGERIGNAFFLFYLLRGQFCVVVCVFFLYRLKFCFVFYIEKIEEKAVEGISVTSLGADVLLS